MKKLFVFAVFCLLLTNFGFSQDKQQVKENLKLSLELRPRSEYYHGYKTLAVENQTPGLITSQRSRFKVDFSTEKIKTRLVLQDVRVWGNQAQLVANEDFATTVHEAWGEVFFTDKISLKAGRMEIVYDDHRLFGNVNWAQQARSHDVAILKYTTSNMHIHFGATLYNQNTTNNIYLGPNAYKAMQFIHFNHKTDAVNLSLIFLNNGKAENEYSLTYNDILYGSQGTLIKQNTVYSQTFGTYFKFTNNDFFVTISGYYQTGKNPADWAIAADSIPAGMSIADNTPYKDGKGKGQKISAFETSVELGKKIDNFLFSIGTEYLSGNSFKADVNTGQINDNNDIENAFTPFYGTNHKFNGFMDYFYVGNHTNNVGLIDIFAKIVYKKDKFFLKVLPHYFMTAGTGVYVTTSGTSFVENTYSGSLGTELDLVCGYKISKDAKIQFGYSSMFPTDNMKALKLGNTTTQIGKMQNWAWLMISFNPTIFQKETTKNN